MRIVVESSSPAADMRAAELAARLDLPVRRSAPADPAQRTRADVVLEVSERGLSLRATAAASTPLRIDAAALAGSRPGRDDLLRAVVPRRAEPLPVIDATAGMGADGFRIAAAGAAVTMIERSAVLHALLGDALTRAGEDPATSAAAARIRLVHGDARQLLHAHEPVPVVYLDPMYPELGKSARKNKAMHLFRTLVGDDGDALELLRVARSVALQRVVVKRPARAAPLAPRPSGSIGGRTVRFDLYPPDR